MNIKETEIRKKLDLVIGKLLNLGGPENAKELEESGGEAIGFFARDFGIREWDWPQGVGLYGLLKVMQYDKNEKYKEFLHDWYVGNMEQGLPSRNINTTTPLLTLVELNEYYHDEKFEELCLDWADWLMNCIPRTKEGGVQHVTSANGDRQGVRLNESEMWIDTLFMTVLFLNRMGQKYQNEEWINEGIHQVLMHIKYLYEKKTGLFYHGWSFNRNDNFGGVFWCRGNSWFTLGILDYIEMFKGTLNPAYPHLNEEEKKVWRPYMMDSIAQLVEEAERLETDMAIEPVYWHPLKDLETTAEVFEKMGSSRLKMIFDPANVLEHPEIDQKRYWREWMSELGDKIEAVHMKDFVVGPEGEYCPVCLGDGVIHYGQIIRWLKENRSDIVIVREELDPKTARKDIRYMRELWESA